MGALGFTGDDIIEGHVDGSRPGQQLDESLWAVSYTHLTLPTILRV